MIPHPGYCDKCQPKTIQLVQEVKGTDGRRYVLCRECWIVKERLEEVQLAIQPA